MYVRAWVVCVVMGRIDNRRCLSQPPSNEPPPGFSHLSLPTPQNQKQGFLRHYGLEQPLSKRTKSVKFEEWTVEFAPPFKHEALRYAFSVWTLGLLGVVGMYVCVCAAIGTRRRTFTRPSPF